MYDWVKLAAAILIKGMRSFVQLVKDLRSTKYGMTIDGSESYPCPSELHRIFQKIPGEWLEKALQRLDEFSVEEFSKFGANLNIFVTDGSQIEEESSSRQFR